MITYEWTLEMIEDGDIVDSDFSDKLTFHKADLPGNDFGLVRNEGNEADGMVDRSWAYVKDGRLPEFFKDSVGNEICKVPNKFHEELRKYLSK